MRTPLKKHAKAWACYLLLGALASVAAAWLITLTGWGELGPNQITVLEHEGVQLLVQGSDGPTMAQYSVASFGDAAATQQLVDAMIRMAARRGEATAKLTSIPAWALASAHEHVALLAASTPKSRTSVSPAAFGWPALAVHCEIVHSRSAAKPVAPRGALAIGKNIVLPYWPLWPGLALNALFYSPVFFGVHEALRWWVRHLRRSNGLCTRCAYDRKGLSPTAPCPECGHTPRVPPLSRSQSPR